MNTLVPDQQLQAGIDGVLAWENTDADGVGAVLDPVPQVTATNAAGDVVIDDVAATADPDVTGRYVVDVGGVDLGSDPDILTVTWTRDDTTTAQTIVELVGRFLFTIRDARQSYETLGSVENYPTALIAKYRMIAENELMWVCDRSFVPRFRTVSIDGSGTRTILIPGDDHGGANELRTVRTATIDDSAITAAELKVYQHRRVERERGDVWDQGQENCVLGYTYGLDSPYGDLKEAALERFRELLFMKTKALPKNATSKSADGTTVALKVDDYLTGNALVDAVYRRYSLRFSDLSGDAGPAAEPYGRSITFGRPDSLFHGGP